eukprot:gene26361-33134_t
MEAQEQIEEVSRIEVEKLCTELMLYREGIKSRGDRKEFDDVWGLDQKGRFVAMKSGGTGSFFNL